MPENHFPTFRNWASLIDQRYAAVKLLKWPILRLQILLICLLALVIYLQEGLYGFKPFMAPWQWALIYGGTIILTLARLRGLSADNNKSWVPIARDAGIFLGTLAALVGVLLMLVSIDDVAQVPRRLAFCLSGLFHGIFISEILLGPHDRTALIDGEKSNRLRWLVTGLAGTVVVGSVFAIYTALDSYLPYSNRQSDELRQFSIPIEQITFVAGKPEITLSSQEKLRPILGIVKQLSRYSSKLELSGEIPLYGDSQLARKRLFTVGEYLEKADIHVSIVGHIGQSSQWGCSPKANTSEFLKTALPDEFPKVTIFFYKRNGGPVSESYAIK